MKSKCTIKLFIVCSEYIFTTRDQLQTSPRQYSDRTFLVLDVVWQYIVHCVHIYLFFVQS